MVRKLILLEQLTDILYSFEKATGQVNNSARCYVSEPQGFVLAEPSTSSRGILGDGSCAGQHMKSGVEHRESTIYCEQFSQPQQNLFHERKKKKLQYTSLCNIGFNIKTNVCLSEGITPFLHRLSEVYKWYFKTIFCIFDVMTLKSPSKNPRLRVWWLDREGGNEHGQYIWLQCWVRE